MLGQLKIATAIIAREKEEPPITANQPPVAGALQWCETLRSMIDVPMDKFKGLESSILDRAEAREVIKM